jgi:hypothetical protein
MRGSRVLSNRRQQADMTGTATQECRYDNLNRLTFAVENGTGPFSSTSTCAGVGGGWCEQFQYDQAGNLTVVGPTGIPLTTISSISTGTNRILDAGWSYDSNGNIIASPSTADQLRRGEPAGELYADGLVGDHVRV